MTTAAECAKAVADIRRRNADDESIASLVERLAGELAKFEGSDAARECVSLRAELDRAKANHLAACGNAQQGYTDLETESKAHLRAAQGEIDALRSQLAARDAELKVAKPLLDAALAYEQARRNEGQIVGNPTRRMHEAAREYALAKLGPDA